MGSLAEAAMAYSDVQAWVVVAAGEFIGAHCGRDERGERIVIDVRKVIELLLGRTVFRGHRLRDRALAIGL